MPPKAFGLHKVSQFFQWIFRWSPLCPHPNFFIIISISFNNPDESLKQLIAKVGIAWTTAFKSTSLPTYERSFSFQPYNLLHTLSLMKLRLTFLFLPTTAGSPRYFSYSHTSLTPKRSRISTFLPSGVDLLKNIVVFSLFNFYPEACLYKLKMHWITSKSLIVERQKRRVSSAKNKWVIFGPFLQREKPLIASDLAVCCNGQFEFSEKIKNRYGVKDLLF